MCDHRSMSAATGDGRPAGADTAAGAERRAIEGATAPVLAGVAADLAARLGVEPVVVRLAFVVLTMAGGAGVLVYALLWLRLVRDGAPVSGVPSPPARTVGDAGQVGLGIAFVGLLLLLRELGVWFGDALVAPVALGGLGSLIIWTRSDRSERDRLGRSLPLPAPLRGLIEDAGRGVRGLGRTGWALPVPPLRLLGGIALVAVAMLGLVAANDALVAVRQLGVVLLAAAVGIGLLFGPWALRLVETVAAERRGRIREEERGELAAHLHDSVLQTLALIQRAGDDPQRMAQLARRQERELRRWLFEGRVDDDVSTVSGALDAAIAVLEESHGIDVELVRVGDTTLTGATTALVAAIREAVGNAAHHGGVDTVAVFLEVTDDEVVAFVRDRGDGFDPTAVAPDRSGVRHSIRGRIERRGGRAVLTTAPGEGCEWELAVPRGSDGTEGDDDGR